MPMAMDGRGGGGLLVQSSGSGEENREQSQSFGLARVDG
jgi:hypothetical protein